MSVLRQIIRRVSGGPNSSLQSFVSNQFALPTFPQVSPFIFTMPTYGVTGGTKNYYDQDSGGIFTSLSIPFIRFQFTGDTSTLNGDTIIYHEIFKLKYETFKMFNLDFERKSQDKTIENNEIIETETIIENGQEKTKIRKLKTEGTKNLTNLTQSGLNTRSDLDFQLTYPICTFTASTSGINSIYEFIPESVVKPKNDEGVNIKSEKLFDDRSQYFIKTYFRISRPVDNSFTEGYRFGNPLSGESKIITAETIDKEYYYTGIDYHVITASTFSGMTIGGLFFTFFEVPSKPKREEPFVDGELNTFSPRFYFSNVNDGDEYVLEINYDLNDTGFTRNIFSSKIIKNLSLEGIQDFSTAIRTNSNFAYRIGNIKKINNIFGVEQRVITYSDTFTGKTQETPAAIHVFSTTDSPYINQVPTITSPSNITLESPDLKHSLSGTVLGTNITGSTVVLNCPDGSMKSITASTVGYFSFEDLNEGTYVLNTSYRGYLNNTRTLLLTGDTEINIRLELLWGNDEETWGSQSNEIF